MLLVKQVAYLNQELLLHEAQYFFISLVFASGKWNFPSCLGIGLACLFQLGSAGNPLTFLSDISAGHH